MDEDSIQRNAITRNAHSSSPISTSSPIADDGFAENDSLNDCGSFISSDDEIDIEVVSEPVDRYAEGLYYPICIGDVLADTYRIIHKLGWGGFSTVWIAQDVKRQKMVALKIGIPGDMAEREVRIRQEISRTVKDTSYLLTLLDTFSLTGVNGQHLVMVFPVRAPSLHERMKSISMPMRMNAARQLLSALKSLHDADIMHCDLNSGSVLWDIGDIGKYTPQMAYREFGRPQKAPVWVQTWKRGELVKPIEVNPELLRGNISLADFGLALKTGSPAKCKWQAPAVYCAPERFHGAGPSFASDMWSYMCLFAELYLGVFPFHGNANTTALSSLVRSLGPLPLQWAGMYEAGGTADKSWYDQTRGLSKMVNLEAISKRSKPNVSDHERKLALSVFSKGFVYLPDDRPTAAELLEDEDFNALVAIHGC